MLNEQTQQQQNTSLVKTAAGMMILTLLSKCIGYVRELVMASAYGTSYITDAYNMAASIPNMLLAGVFAALSTSYMPTYSGIMAKDGEKAGNRFTSQLVSILFIVSTIALVLGFIFSDQLVYLFAHNFNEQTAALTSFYLKVAFGWTFLISGMDILQAYLRYHGKFYPQIILGYFFNAIVITMIIVSSKTSYYYLVLGFFLGYLVQFIGTSIVAKKNSFSFKFDTHLSEPIKQIFILAIPVFIGSSIGSINTFVDKTLASGLPEGSITALTYGNLGVGVFTTLTSTIIATIMYPQMTRAAANKEWDIFNSSTKTAMVLSLLIMIPCTFGIIAYHTEIIQVIFERGAFNANSTTLTASAFLFYGLGMTFNAINLLIIQVYYSLKDTRRPLISSAIGIIFNIGFNLLLINSMQHKGLALATSISAVINVIVLNLLLRKKYPNIHVYCGFKKIIKLISASIIAIGLSYFVYLGVKIIIIPRMIVLAIALLFAIVVYFVMLKLLKVEESELLLRFFQR